MFYWLYTQVQPMLAGLFLPLLCLTLVLPIVLSLILGRGIQRSDEGSQMTAPGWRVLVQFATFVVVMAGISAIYLSVTHGVALQPRSGAKQPTSEFLLLLAGGPDNIAKNKLLTLGIFWFFLMGIACLVLREGVRNGGWLRERIDRLRRPSVKRGAMGSAHLCTSREYRRFRRYRDDGITFYGAFWGNNRLRLDYGYGRLCLNDEDAARGVLTLGGPGSGKTQGVILPIIADRMLAGHSLLVADPQGELSAHVLRFAQATGHLVVIHDPTSQRSTARYNLAQGINNVSDARAIANVLIPAQGGDNKFWSDSATALLAACLINFDNLGDIYSSLSDLKKLADVFNKNAGDAALLANSFLASVNSDGKVASNVVATLATALTGWADTTTRANTYASDFDADLIVSSPVVVVLTCPGRMRDVYASYLGATLRKLMLDLDTIGEQNRDKKRPGALPVPVGIILDEFPTLGKLDSLVKDVNLVRKRRISILIGAQSKGQFHDLYGENGTQTLFTGMATQIVYGGCDIQTAEFYSKASGTATADSNDDPDHSRANYRQRPLLTADEIITPFDGNCTIFARYVEAAYATQVVMNAQLTRMYERVDWRKRMAAAKNQAPLVLTRTRPVRPPQPVMPAPVTAAPAATAQAQPAKAPDLIPYIPRGQSGVSKTLPEQPKGDVPSSKDALRSQVEQIMTGAPVNKLDPGNYPNAMRAKQGKQ